MALGSDENLELLKQKAPYFSQNERLFIIKNIKVVTDAFISSGSGVLDFEADLKRIKPDYFVVNEDGHTPEKKRLCEELGVHYKVLKRSPPKDLPARASSLIKKELRFPYRIALAGGWIDQPWVSRIKAGAMVVVSILPTTDFWERSGFATSSRKVAVEIWGDRLPEGKPERMAQLLFGAENPPGSEYVSGSQDHLGLMLPGISRLYYNGQYWPEQIQSTRETETCEWLESVLHVFPCQPRHPGFDPLHPKNLDYEWIKQLGESGELCYRSILEFDVKGLGQSLKLSLEAWQHILPSSVLESTLKELRQYASYPGATFAGAGGGYILVVSEQEIPGAIKIKIRR